VETLLWVDFGIVGPPDEREFTIDELRDWLRWSAALAKGMKGNVRTVFYLGLVGSAETIDRLRGGTDALADELWSLRFRWNWLPVLKGQVSKVDLLEYLTEPGQSSCPPSLVRQVADLIWQASQGEYEEVLRLLERGEEQTFAKLLVELA
jgi:hypothetical protein